MTTLDDRSGLAALLAWYRDMGVDCAVAEAAENWLVRPDRAPGQAFRVEGLGPPPQPPGAGMANPAAATPPPRSSPAAAPPRPATAPPAPRTPAATPPDAAETAARAAARNSGSLEALGAALAAFDGCALKATAKSLCFYRGAPKARLMIIGEAPGRDEDLAGKPFVGPAGQLLDKMLAAIGLDETSVHITNVVYWRPPGNRTPTPQEAQTCRPFLERQAELVAPEFVLLLGGAATKHILNVESGIMATRGKWSEISLGAHRARALPTLHPAYLLRSPAHKRQAWRDLLSLKAALGAAD